MLRLKYNKNNKNIKFSLFLLTIYHKNNENIKFSIFLLKTTPSPSYKNNRKFIFPLFL